MGFDQGDTFGLNSLDWGKFSAYLRLSFSWFLFSSKKTNEPPFISLCNIWELFRACVHKTEWIKFLCRNKLIRKTPCACVKFTIFFYFSNNSKNKSKTLHKNTQRNGLISLSSSINNSKVSFFARAPVCVFRFHLTISQKK